EEIQKGLEFEPNNDNLKAYQQRFFDEWLGIIYNEAVRANNDGRYAEAKARLQQISKLSPGYLNTEELLDEVRTTLASAAYDRAQSILSEQDRAQIGIAVANLLVAQQEHSALYPDIEERIEEAKKMLRKELEFRVSVDFKNSSQDPSAAGLVREQILSKMGNHPALNHITILDRDALDDILREQGLGQGFLDETTALQVKKIKGIQAGIKGEVIKLDVKETGRERPSYGSARYVSGTRWVPNPDYMRAQSDVQASQQRVLSAQQSLNDAKRQQNQMMQQQQNVNTNDNPWGALAAGLGQVSTTLQEGEVNRAQNDLSNAQSRLINTPQQIEEDIYSDYRYEIFDLKLNAEAVISIKVINFTTSEIGQVQTVRETDSVTDRYIPGDPSKNVPSDPLQLPSLDEMKNTILNKAIDKTFAALLSDLSTQAQNYYTLAKRAEKSNSTDDAVENYMRYIYSAPDLSDAKVQEANEYIYNHIGIRVLRRKE
ncbi:MAG: hypothetical protein K8I00_13095, partial [Candidatus Omnitrophica bacterium]|nr:hypothetical protein [Candidatus Omnitrophota bacterium]